jgi:beta-lactamase superfamily II metal-dependent hydrolase
MQISPEEYADEYLDDPIEYFNDEFSGLKTKVWRFIATHPDMDHLSGLTRLKNEIGFDVMWDTNHMKELDTDEDWPDEYAKEDWKTYQQIRDGSTDHTHITPTRNEQKNYWEQDNVQILHPSPAFVSDLNENNGDKENPEYNDISYVLKINHGNQSFLLPGDAETDAWEDIIEKKGLSIFNDVTILKAAHHGREDGFHREAVEAMDPDHVILSVGSKPSTDAHDKYRDACSEDTEIWSTRQYGTIKITSTGRRASVKPSVTDGIFNLPPRA